MSNLKSKSMKKMMMVFALVVFTTAIRAQDYKTGIGFRLAGINYGITVKHFIGNETAIEGILGFGRGAFTITGLYEKHQAFPNAEGLKWFYGGGAHVGFFQAGYNYAYYYYYKNKGYKYYYNDYPDGAYSSNVFIGADFILGLEYKFKGAPISLGLDVKPQVDFIPGFYGYFDGALTFRFTL